MITRGVKEVYLSVFVLFFGISRWRGSMKARTAASGLTLVVGFLASSVGIWIEVATRQSFLVNRWAVAIAFLVLYLVNDHFLVDQGRGVAFDNKFRNFRTRKKTVLYIVAVGVVLLAGVSLYSSVTAYHRAVGIS